MPELTFDPNEMTLDDVLWFTEWAETPAMDRANMTRLIDVLARACSVEPSVLGGLRMRELTALIDVAKPGIAEATNQGVPFGSPSS
jgi:hypothetical protein